MKKKRKISLFDIFIKLVIFAGICLLFYPTISNKWNEMHQTQIIAGYATAVENFTEQDYTDVLNNAIAYNESLLSTKDRFKPSQEELDKYNQTLDITGDGLMAYVEIPKINVKLPIYHSVDEAILQVAAGHIPGSSLPIGGPNTHSAISGHCGLTSASLFTHLNQLDIGDLFYIQVLNDTLAYQVDQIDIVLPDEFDLLHIDDQEDYCTLITCTPYGVNSHRLLVRGTRIPYEPEVKQEIQTIKPDDQASKLDSAFLYIGIAAIAILIIITCKNIVKKRKAKKFEERRETQDEKDE